jgi:hypothetical protein
MNAKRIVWIAVLLGAIATWLVLRRDNSTMDRSALEFAVADSSRITRIFLAARTGEQVTISRAADGGWLVNDSMPARADLMRSLLESIVKVRVKTRVAKASFNNVLKALATDGVKCEVYLDGDRKPEKVYYVGGPTADQLGTYMLQEEADIPFICEIPGFNGYLTPRYSASADDWKERLLFSFRPESIQSVKVHYPARPEMSFELLRRQDGFRIQDPVRGNDLGEPDTLAIRSYFFLLRSAPYEGPANKLTVAGKDSLLSIDATVELEIKAGNDKSCAIRLYPMPVHAGSLAKTDSLGNPLKYDVDRLYAQDATTNSWFVVQHFTFDPLLRTRYDFLMGKK